ncbi:ATP-binding protein [Pseudoblastomonas halimionae]|uniref:histidine kinase n=1 Tax=Alteriqipengyuania halimionae TaxID=1926630 RepID=A0A6I4U174_9SPHN|nr:ATP-binding protein [Alteriqipengyuania halimionae]MXP09809.1 response regulator [Alteriqipengyuania halimionae]
MVSIVVAVGLLLSALALWLATDSAVAVLSYLGAVAVLGGAGWLMLRDKASETIDSIATPDWSVTVTAMDRSDMAIAITDRAGRLTCANATFADNFGITKAPPHIDADQTSLDALMRGSRDAWRDGRADAGTVRAEGEIWAATLERAGRAGDYLIWRFRRQVSPDLTRAAVEAVTGKLGRALDQAGIVSAIVEPDGYIVAASSGFALRATGEPESDMAHQEFVSFLRQDEDDRISYARDGKNGAPITMYYLPIADPDRAGNDAGDSHPSLMLLVDSGIGLGGGSGDLATAVPNLEALLAQLPLGLAMADRDGLLLFANPAFMRAAGRDGEAPPPYPSDLVVQEDKGALSNAVRRFAQGPATSGDVAVRLSIQPEEPVSLNLAGVRGLGNAAVLLGLNDNSEEKRLKRQIAQATKMQAVGQLAGGVAHDFNNVLTAILGICDLMLLRHTPGDSDYDDIQQIRANSNRAASLTRQLLAFSRQQTLRPEVLQLPDVVSEVSQMLKRLIGEKIRLQVTHDRNLGRVRADPSQLEQVIVNLAVNARDAVQAKGEGRGELRIATKRVTAADIRAMRSEIVPAGDYTVLVVSDTGTGIPPDKIGKIFEPFFTTKEQGKGTGLGLSTVYGIVKQSGGFIFADSEMGKGTTFSVYLPVFHESPDAKRRREEADKPAAPQREWAGGGKLLLVEDEDPVRAVAERALSRQGYEVVTASDGEEGLEYVQRGEEFDLIVSDVVMPVMDGPAMARAIREKRPDLPILFMSGYAEEQLRREIDIEDMHFLPKPFSVAQIADKVAKVLGGSKGGNG